MFGFNLPAKALEKSGTSQLWRSRLRRVEPRMKTDDTDEKNREKSRGIV
jgi:hypothetical protein